MLLFYLIITFLCFIGCIYNCIQIKEKFECYFLSLPLSFMWPIILILGLYFYHYNNKNYKLYE